jgi:hypothetical protein
MVINCEGRGSTRKSRHLQPGEIRVRYVCLVCCSFDAGFDSSSLALGLPVVVLAASEGADVRAEVISEPSHELGLVALLCSLITWS